MISNSGHVMTLANSIIGVGILAMPFCFQKCGIILSIFLLILNNWISRISCHYLIKSSLLTRRRSFEFLGLYAFGSSGKLFVELCTIGYLLGTCITYFVVVGDIGPQIAAKIFNLNNEQELRSLVMVAVTVICVLPLGMLKNVDSLSTVCTASVGFYICFVIKIILESKNHIVAHDWSSNIIYWDSSGILQCLPIFSMALSCQMQLFEIFESINNQSIEKLNSIVRNAAWICTCVYIFVGIFGYIAFCNQTFSGNILINFSPSFGSDIIKIGFVLSVAFSFPLVIFPCRASIYSLLYRRGHTDTSTYIPENRFKSITISIIMISLLTALLVPSVELVIGLVGSTIGVAICIIFPASCFRKISKKESAERTLAQVILISGFSLMILGTYANLSAIDERRSAAVLISHDFDIPHKSKVSEIIENFHVFNTPKFVQTIEHIPVQKVSPNLKDSNVQNLPTNSDVLDNKYANQSYKQSLPLTVSNNDNAFEENTQDGLNTSNVVERKNTSLQSEFIKRKSKKLPIKLVDQDAMDLKEAQSELKRTKELLEKKVDELKEEIFKQSIETQNFVAEKLDEVVLKVEKIEREVNEKVKVNVAGRPNISTENNNNSKTIKITAQPTLTENKKIIKTDEINKETITQKQDHRFPLPLALLVNTSQPKDVDKFVEFKENSTHSKEHRFEKAKQDEANFVSTKKENISLDNRGELSENKVSKKILANKPPKRDKRSTDSELKIVDEVIKSDNFLITENFKFLAIKSH